MRAAISSPSSRLRLTKRSPDSTICWRAPTSSSVTCFALPFMTTATRSRAMDECSASISESDETRPPGEAGAERREEDEIALPGAALLDGLAERERDRGGRGVAVFVDVLHHLLGRDAELAGHELVDAGVGLVRDHE